ncbi:hypothetical protein LDENG_00150930 [Lucifuga dentata]|nr:hypothetical protein LDENG_00150930 [Lucifuga dentata]
MEEDEPVRQDDHITSCLLHGELAQTANATAQLANRRQPLATMSRKQSELEGRLNDTLSRIAIETQEIKELEQQLTDSQILVNEALQRDLEGIISGLQEYLRGLREQTRCGHERAHSLQVENHTLQRQLEDTKTHCRWLEETNRTYRQDLCVQQEELSVLRREAQALRRRQVQSNRQQVGLEAELQQLREELNHQLRLGQDKISCLHQTVHKLQVQLRQTRSSMLDPQQVQNRLQQLVRALNRQDHFSPIGPQDLLSASLKQLYREIHKARTTRDQVLKAHNQSQEQIARLQTQLTQDQDQIARLQWTLEQKEDLEKLRDKLQRSQSHNPRQTQHRMHSESDGHQKNLRRLHRKPRRPGGSTHESDQLTAKQLRSAAEQLRHLKTSVELLERERERTRTRTKDGGWCYIPPGCNGASLGSQGTQDSGLGWQHFSSPDRRRHRDTLPTGSRYTPPTHTDSETGAEWRDSGGGSDGGRSSRGGTPPLPPGPAEGLRAGLSDGGPPAGCAVLLCNVPQHRQREECVCESLHREADRLEEEKKKLRQERKQLQHTLRRHRSVLLLCDEVECVEKTLLKRRAELRHADRLLLEAQSCIHTTRDKVSSAQRGADMLEDSSTYLLEAQQQFR